MKKYTLKVVVYIIGVFIVFTYGNSCVQSEYELSSGDCCPMCSPGNVVLKDCTEYTSTTCIPCVKGTFMNEPNGLHRCFACKTCDNGLFVSNECTTLTNTVCGVNEGYYCNEFSRGDCSHAVPHSTCAPGQQVKSPGTTTSNVVCENCPLGFYSPNGTSCHQWTDCLSEGKVQDKKGTSINDVQCKLERRGRYGFIFVAMCLLLSIAVISMGMRKSLASHKGDTQNKPQGKVGVQDLQSPVEESCISLPEENQEDG